MYEINSVADNVTKYNFQIANLTAFDVAAPDEDEAADADEDEAAAADAAAAACKENEETQRIYKCTQAKEYQTSL